MTRRHLLILLVVYIVSAAVSFSVFAIAGPAGGGQINVGQQEPADDETLLTQLLEIDPSEPKDQACPLNGQLYTKAEADAWQKRRPLAVMIENSPDARPQSGLSISDIVFEAVAEGGVTRFMALFYCGVQRQDTIIAPVRSARSYFIDWASGFNLPLYVHVGGANLAGPANALGQLGEYGWNLENDLNQFSIGYPTFVRNANRLEGKEVATEHTMETSSERLWAIALKRDWTNMSPERKYGRKVIPAEDWQDGYEGWSFVDGKSGSEVSEISYEFWSGYNQYAVNWKYETASNTFKRSQGGETHTDLNNGQHIAASNVIVLLTKEKGPIDELKHMLYTTIGKGNALIFKNGTVEKATWSKPTREAELEFLTASGKPVELTRGLTWISVLDASSEVNY